MLFLVVVLMVSVMVSVMVLMMVLLVRIIFSPELVSVSNIWMRQFL